MDEQRTGLAGRRARLATLVVTVSVVGVVMAWSIAVGPLLERGHGWIVPNGVWPPMQAAHYVANGALGYVYASTRHFTGMPGIAVVLSPVGWIADRLGLTESHPYHLPYPSVWPLYGTYALGLSWPLISGARALAQELGVRRRLLALQVAVAAAVVVPVSVFAGRVDVTLALGLVVLAARRAARNEIGVAALLLSVAIAVRPEAAVLVPALVLRARPGRRRATAVRSVALPSALLALAFAVDPHDTARGLTPGRPVLAVLLWALALAAATAAARSIRSIRATAPTAGPDGELAPSVKGELAAVG